MLIERFTQPPGWQWTNINPRGEQILRVGWASPANPRALAVVLPGLSEYCEKYFEVVRDLLARNIAAVVVDWRGQGLSWRHLPDRMKRHHDDFSDDIADAAALVKLIDAVPSLKTLPRFVLGHSMGGHIALRLMHDDKPDFRCAVLTSPMMGINLPMGAENMFRHITDAFALFGMKEHYVPGSSAWSPAIFHHNISLLTSDPERRDMQWHWLNENTDLRMGGLTYGWLRAALASTHLTTHNPAWLKGISVPCLIVMAEREMIVSNTAIRAGAHALPNVELVEVKGALHEILMEKDQYRNQFWTAFDAFVAKHLAAE